MTFRERFEKVIEGRAEESVKPYIMSLRSIDRTSLPEAYIFGYHEAAQDILPLIEECYEALNDAYDCVPKPSRIEGEINRAITKLNALLGEGGEYPEPVKGGQI